MPNLRRRRDPLPASRPLPARRHKKETHRTAANHGRSATTPPNALRGSRCEIMPDQDPDRRRARRHPIRARPRSRDRSRSSRIDGHYKSAGADARAPARPPPSLGLLSKADFRSECYRGTGSESAVRARHRTLPTYWPPRVPGGSAAAGDGENESPATPSVSANRLASRKSPDAVANREGCQHLTSLAGLPALQASSAEGGPSNSRFPIEGCRAGDQRTDYHTQTRPVSEAC